MPLQNSHKPLALKKFLDYINEHLDEIYSVASLAEKSCGPHGNFNESFVRHRAHRRAIHNRDYVLTEREFITSSPKRHIDIAISVWL